MLTIPNNRYLDFAVNHCPQVYFYIIVFHIMVKCWFPKCTRPFGASTNILVDLSHKVC